MSTTISFDADSLTDWLAYLASPSRHRIDLGLERIRRMASALHLMEWPCPVITVAGTNGKGSTVAMLEAMYVAQGYRVGSFTSPHLEHFNERMRINARAVSDGELCQTFQTLVDRHNEVLELTYFEFTTLAALQLFKSQHLDILILEVGLGGRLDATNIVDADVAIVTSIALDHCHYLGNTRELIGGEKAGIFRGGRLAVCGDPHPPKSLFARATYCGAHLECVGRDFNFTQSDDVWSFQNHHLTLSGLPLPSLLLDNAALAVHAVSRLSAKITITEEAIRQALSSVNLPGRCQWFPGKINHLYDVAHNPHACERLAAFVVEHCQEGKVYAVMSMLKDKDVSASVKSLIPWVDAWHVAPLEDERGASVEQLGFALESQHAVDVKQHNALLDAYRSAYSQAQAGDSVIIFGSFVTVAKLISFRV